MAGDVRCRNEEGIAPWRRGQDALSLGQGKEADVKAVHNSIDGPYVIEEDIALYGTINGGATVQSGRRFILHGTIVGDLKVERGARAILHGTVAGRVYNDGGRVELFGMANAVANSSGDAITVIDPAAHVMGRR